MESYSRGKTPCMVSEPKIPYPKEVNSYRPVALTSNLVKTLGGTGPYSPLTARQFLVRQSAVNQPGIGGCHPPAAVTYNSLGFHLNNELDWSDTTNALSKKGQSRRFLLRKPKSFEANGTLQQIPYDSVVSSVIYFWVVCKAGITSARDKKKLDRLVRRTSSILGCQKDAG